MALFTALDREVGEFFRKLGQQNPGLVSVMNDLTALGSKSVLIVVVVFAAGLLMCAKRYRTACFVVIATVGGTTISSWIKTWVARPRPPDAAVALAESFRSFPSGHSMLSATVYLTLALIATAVIHHRRIRIFVVGASLVVVGLVGVSRLVLGVHYLTDVIGGWMIGATWALACRWIEFRWVLRLEKRDEMRAKK